LLAGAKFKPRGGFGVKKQSKVIELKRVLKGLLALIMALAAGMACRASVPVFCDGKILLPVVIAADAVPEERAAAKELARGLGLMSGLNWPVLTESLPGRAGFYVGRTHSSRQPARLKASADLLASGKGEVGPDGFRIRSEQGSVFIEGATPEATCFAVAWLLQHRGGVRWFSPGAIGEVIPRRTAWSLPEMNEVHEPAFLSREISGLDSREAIEWARRNGLGARLEFSHALAQVFSHETLAANPDWRPQLNGLRYEPAAVDDDRWQPNLASAEVSEHAAESAAAAFAQDPTKTSYSLGINDTVRFDQSDATRALVEPLQYFRGMPDYSPLVFTFMNRAASSLARTNPERYVGCLAYFWCENVPSFPVNSRVVPYVTTDRSQYYDRNYRAADLDLMSRWGRSGVTAFGLWEYAYGHGFLVPRMPLGALAGAVREGWHRGARGYKGEVGPQWGFDTFKVWMLAQLLWEPDRTVEDLANDFYRGYYAAASGPMRRFFERCEEMWMSQRGPPYWLKFYQQEDQALLFPAAQVRELRGLLNEAKRAVAADPVLTVRVDLTSRAFAITEAYLEFDAIRRALAEMKMEGLGSSEAAISKRIADLLKSAADLQAKLAAAATSPIPAMSATDLTVFMRNDPVPRLLWLAGQRDPASPRRILTVAGLAADEHSEWWALADVLAVRPAPAAEDLVANGSFVETDAQFQEPRFLYPHSGVLPAKWTWRAMPTEKGKVDLVDSGEGRGGRALRIEGAWDTQFFQWLPAKPDRVYVARAQFSGCSSPGNDSALFLTFLSATGKVVGLHRMQSLPKGETLAWRTVVLADAVPAGAVWVGVGAGASRQIHGDWLKIRSVSLIGVDRAATP